MAKTARNNLYGINVFLRNFSNFSLYQNVKKKNSNRSRVLRLATHLTFKPTTIIKRVKKGGSMNECLLYAISIQWILMKL